MNVSCHVYPQTFLVFPAYQCAGIQHQAVTDHMSSHLIGQI